MTMSRVPFDVLTAIAARHGILADQVRPIPAGVANHVYAFGADLVLRIPRSSAFAADLRKEAAVIPMARARRVQTPPLFAYDEGGSVAGVTYMLVGRAIGLDLEALGLTDRDSTRIYREVGRNLARLHGMRRDDHPEPDAVPLGDEELAPDAVLARLRDGGQLDAEAAVWLSGWFGRLAARLPDPLPRCLVHGDIAPQNLMVDPEAMALSGIVDWGDAMWTDPAVEFAKLPLAAVSSMLIGYREATGVSDRSDEMEARALWYHLLWALRRLEDPVPRPGERHWTAPPMSRLMALFRFFSAGPPEPWSALT